MISFIKQILTTFHVSLFELMKSFLESSGVETYAVSFAEITKRTIKSHSERTILFYILQPDLTLKNNENIRHKKSYDF